MTVTISIGSGKGGTGKTTIIANLAVLLARTGKKVCLVDLDLGGQRNVVGIAAEDAHIGDLAGIGDIGVKLARSTIYKWLRRDTPPMNEI